MMKRHIRSIVTATILLVALGAGLYTQRVRISDVLQGATKPELPKAVTFEEVKEAEVAKEVEEGKVVEEVEETKEPEEVKEPKEILPEPVEGSVVVPAPVAPSTSSGNNDASSLPVSFNLAVPFTSQAPFANWDEVHEETCEEASLYMAHLYFQGVPEGRVDPQTADNELLRIVDVEMNVFGYYKDTTAEETATLIKTLYGYERVELLRDPTVEEIKRQVAAGRPVIVPAAGRLLGNPNFTPPGPIYHMLVVRGWTQNGFIVNDPGTRRGEGYSYAFETLMYAMHDWNGGDVENGAKIAIVIYPNP